MPLNAEAVEQRLLHHLPLAHHGLSPSESARQVTFSTKSAESGPTGVASGRTGVCAIAAIASAE
jgi:hypothetical protein